VHCRTAALAIRRLIAMKRIFLSMFLLVLSTISYSQDYWEMDINDTTGVMYVFSGLNDNGDAIMVGGSGPDLNHIIPMFAKLSKDYEFTKVNYGEEVIGHYLTDVVMLPNGNYFAIGTMKEQDLEHSYALEIMIVDKDMNLVTSKVYEKDSIVSYYRNRNPRLFLDDDGTVVASCSFVSSDPDITGERSYMMRFDENANMIHSRYNLSNGGWGDRESRLTSYICSQILKDPQTGGLIFLATGGNGVTSAVLFYDNDFNYVSDFTILDGYKPMFSEACYSDLWLSDEELLVIGSATSAVDSVGNPHVGLARINLDGSSPYHIPVCPSTDTIMKTSVTRTMKFVNDSTIYGIFEIYRTAVAPYYTGVCLFSRDMEVLGSIRLLDEEHKNLCPQIIMSYEDDGCLVEVIRNKQTTSNKLIKFSREDFNPIPCSVKEVTKERLKATAFPNPTYGELNIDISNLPGDTENRVSITDMQGVVRMSRIIRGDGNLLTIDASSLEAGSYVYSVFNSESEILKGKFVKK